jgi:uncharacterized repeat protein (TIGR01451 family)
MRTYSRSHRRSKVAAFVTAVIAAMLALTSVALANQSITSSGPLTTIRITNQLNCDVRHTGDSSPEFYGQTACGTFLVAGAGGANSLLFGPRDVPAGDSANPRTAWTEVSQTAVLGAGTSANPYRVTTVADAGTTGLRVTETDSYVVGQEAYRTDVAISNSGNAAQNVIVYRAGDCYLQNSDRGFGRVDAATGAVACTTSQAANARIEQWFPITPGSHYYEANYDDVWARIGAKLPFPDTCICSTFDDNGAGLSWSLTIPAGLSMTVSHFTTFSPLGLAPLSTTKTADAATATGGASDGYTITIHNPNASAATLNSITDTLPAGFTYTAGSTTGVTTTNPAVSGQTLIWAGPFSVPASGDVTLHFNVKVATATGVYFNNASADASAIPVAPTGPTAPITVTAGGGEAPPPSTQRTVLLANSTSCGQVTLTASQVQPGLPHQIVVTPQGGGTSTIVDVTAQADQKVAATVTTGGGVFTAFVRMTSNQVTVSNTVIFAVTACPTPTPTPTPPPVVTKPSTPAATPAPTPTPIAQLPSTTTGADGGLPIALAVLALALAAMAWRRRYSRT